MHHIMEAQCCSTLEDIKRHTGANTGCGTHVQSVIAKSLALLQNNSNDF